MYCWCRGGSEASPSPARPARSSFGNGSQLPLHASAPVFQPSSSYMPMDSGMHNFAMRDPYYAAYDQQQFMPHQYPTMSHQQMYRNDFQVRWFFLSYCYFTQIFFYFFIEYYATTRLGNTGWNPPIFFLFYLVVLYLIFFIRGNIVSQVLLVCRFFFS